VKVAGLSDAGEPKVKVACLARWQACRLEIGQDVVNVNVKVASL
jgi:hypothetical protein